MNNQTPLAERASRTSPAEQVLEQGQAGYDKMSYYKFKYVLENSKYALEDPGI